MPEAAALPNAIVQHDTTLQSLDPRFGGVLRIRMVVRTIPLLIATAIADAAAPVPGGSLFVPALLLAVAAVIVLPMRQYRSWSYLLSDDRLQVKRGLLFRADTVVPFGRVQHIDVNQGPLERSRDLAALTLYTAGTHNASVTLPGLPHAQALAMREAIRSHIRQDTM